MSNKFVDTLDTGERSSRSQAPGFDFFDVDFEIPRSLDPSKIRVTRSEPVEDGSVAIFDQARHELPIMPLHRDDISKVREATPTYEEGKAVLLGVLGHSAFQGVRFS